MTSTPPREQALKILHRVDTQNAYATQLLDHVSRDSSIDDRDRAMIQQLVKGTLAWRGKLDSILEGLVKNGTGQLTPWIRNILRLGAYQLLFLDRVAPGVAVNESVNLAKRYGHAGTARLVNAVLHKIAARPQSFMVAPAEQDTAAAIATTYSHPEWLVSHWIQQIGPEETRALCAANNGAWPPCIRTNTLKTSTAELRELLDGAGVLWRPGRYQGDCSTIAGLPPGTRIHTLESYRSGLFQVQDESFALVAQLVDPQPGECIVDLCSAPGGKTTHLAALMGNQGRVVAVDLHEHRLALVRENCARLGVTIVEELRADGRGLQLDQPADKVLVDAPCSGLGVLGRRSDARWNKSEDDLPGLRVLQLELLEHAATLLRPGGRLIYTTCTTEPDENEGMVEAFLKQFPHYSLVDVGGSMPAELLDLHGYYRTWPHRHGMGGAFGAVMLRAAT